MRSKIIETAEADDSHRSIAANFRSIMRAHFRAHALNVQCSLNPETLLCTDILNQYARLIMLFEIFPSAPYTVAPHLFGWQAKNYARYFIESKHPEHGFIMRAFRYADPKAVLEFEDALARLNEMAERGLATLRLIMAHGRVHEARGLCKASANAVRLGVAAATAIAAPEADNKAGMDKKHEALHMKISRSR